MFLFTLLGLHRFPELIYQNLDNNCRYIVQQLSLHSSDNLVIYHHFKEQLQEMISTTLYVHNYGEHIVNIYATGRALVV